MRPATSSSSGSAEAAAPATDDAVAGMLLRASRCEVQQHVLGGMLHDLNGPLNTVALTLALVSAGVTRSLAAAPQDAALTRLARHVATLGTEVRRLADSSQAMSRTLHESLADAPPEPVELAVLVADVRRRLRHHAALRDIVVEELVATDDGVVVHAVRDGVQLALSGLLLGAFAACQPDARVTLHTARRGDRAIVTIGARPAALPDGVRVALDAMVIPPPEAALHLAAGRLAMRAQGGVVSFGFGADEIVIDVALPATR